MTRAKTRSRKGSRPRRASDDRTVVVEELRNRRYIAFVRAIVGAARVRNSSR